MAEETPTAIIPSMFGNIAANTTVYNATEVAALISALETKFNNKIAGVMDYKGQVATVEALDEIENPKTGDTYDVAATGDNYAWNGTSWDKLASTFSLPTYLSTSSLDAKYLQITNIDTELASRNYVKTDVTNALSTRITNLETVGAQANVLEAIKIKTSESGNYVTQTISADKAVQIDLSIYALKSALGTMAGKDEVTEDELGETLKAKINAAATSTEVNAIKAKMDVAKAVELPERAGISVYDLYDALKSLIEAFADASAE